MHLRRLRHMLPQIVRAYVHQLRRVQRTSTEMRGVCRMSGPTGKGKIDRRRCKRGWILHSEEGMWMPGESDVDIPEQAVSHHERLGGTAFLGWASIVANPTRNPI